MRHILAAALAAGLVLTGTAQAKPSLTPQQRLDKMLEGRTAGKPQDCLLLREIQSSQIIDRTAIVYTVGSKLYVNRPKSGADLLNSSYILVTNTHTPELCSIDIVKLVDSGTRSFVGTVGLDKFVPYTKPRG